MSASVFPSVGMGSNSSTTTRPGRTRSEPGGTMSWLPEMRTGTIGIPD